MQIVPYERLREVATPARIVEAVRQGFIAYEAGRIRQAPQSHLAFVSNAGDVIGDCHVKWGHQTGSSYFTIKVATGFYNNPGNGLASSNGLMLLLSAHDGAPIALLEDRGFLTDARTAAAGVLAVEGAGIKAISTLGIVGTGTQARMQAQWIAFHNRVSRIIIWGRNPLAAEELQHGLREAGLDVILARSISDLTRQSDVIVTTTPSSSPLIMNDDVIEGTVIIAVGADAPGKRELDPAVLRRAARIICDDVEQCRQCGEVQFVEIDETRIVRLGQLLSGSLPTNRRKDSGIAVADLTGLAAQDVAVAEACWKVITS